jgi:hypothetical protein
VRTARNGQIRHSSANINNDLNRRSRLKRLDRRSAIFSSQKPHFSSKQHFTVISTCRIHAWTENSP